MAATSTDDEFIGVRLLAFPNLLKTTCPVDFAVRGLDVINRVHRRVAWNKGVSRIDPLDTDSDGLDQQCPAATHAVRALVIESREEPNLSQKARG